ncbi:MAG TPA: DnaB-like helicase C-terminal domain-containing protein [Fibrobacteria bacterium]|nr:DnaB-like helicase C-terminal domain-containing protein [Fibrobacteria bacterium]
MAQDQEVIDTGYKQLNEMLGGGLRPGVTLIRGAPGSGKTTLCMNIINEFLIRNKNEDVYFFSLEMDPDAVMGHASEKFDLHLKEYSKRILSLRRQDFEKDLTTIAYEMDPGKIFVEAATTIDPANPVFSSALALGKITQFFKKQFKALNDRALRNSQIVNGVRLMVIDSINVLINIISHELPGADVRQVLNILCREAHLSAADPLRPAVQPVILFTGEYHSSAPDKIHPASESFFCDTEILLHPEPIHKENGHRSDEKISLGYDIGTSKKNDIQAIETRSFCRVLKSRFSRSQSRRCLYDIMPGKGVVFFESYPGDGQMLLFAENQPQHAELVEFNRYVLPLSYPTLRSETFDRNNLQRVFAGLRHLRNVPSRTDLYFSSFDSYWINWYNDLWERWQIREEIRRVVPSRDKKEKEELQEVLKMIPDIHTVLREYLSDKKGFPALNQRIAEARLNIPLISDLAGFMKTCAEKIQDGVTRGTFFSTIKFSDLKLYGEKRSNFVLRMRNCDRNRWVRLPDGHKGNEEDDSKLSHSTHLHSVPYDANVSMYVFEKNRIHEIRDTPRLKEKYIQEIKHLIDDERFAMSQFFKDDDGKRFLEKYPEYKDDYPEEMRMTSDAIAEQAEKRIDGLEKEGPQSWEEMIAMAKVLEMHVGVETQTFDTFLCTFLEVVWNCGAEIKTNPSYVIADKDFNLPRIFHAFFLLFRMFQDGIIPKNCTLELGKGGEDGSNRDFLFTRHWYSTFVNQITETDAAGEFKWKPKQVSVGLMKIPVSLLFNHEQLEKDRKNAGDQTKKPGRDYRKMTHHSCWGDWHFGILNGSENMALGTELINHFMSSQKVRDRAFAGASLPSVSDFYTIYGDTRCFNFSNRKDVFLPDISFNKIKNTFFPGAKKRDTIFDYRHTMREFHALLSSINSFANTWTHKDLIKRFFQAIANIEALKHAELLSGG